MPEIVMIAVDEIHRRADARLIADETVAELADSIGDLGLTTPVSVRSLATGGFELIAGNHRFAACDSLGWPEIPCIVVDDDDTAAELRMIDENLCRSELSPSDRARQTARRKALYEQLHPETRNGATGNGREKVRQDGEAAPAERFTAETAGASGRSERAVQRDVERGTKISADALDVVKGTKLDTGAYLDKLKRLPSNQQVHAARHDLTISQKADRAEAGALPRSSAPVAPDPEPIDQFAAWIELTEQTSELTADAIFAACPVSRRPVLSQRCEAVRAILDALDDLIEKPPRAGGAA